MLGVLPPGVAGAARLGVNTVCAKLCSVPRRDTLSGKVSADMVLSVLMCFVFLNGFGTLKAKVVPGARRLPVCEL
jgi:hypothetical protein